MAVHEEVLNRNQHKILFSSAFYHLTNTILMLIPDNANFDYISSRVHMHISCGSEDFKNYEEEVRCKLHMYAIDVVEFIEALRIWVEKCLIKCHCKASWLSIMVDECIDANYRGDALLIGER